MVCGSHPKIRAIYSTPPCPNLAASTAAYRRRSFSDSHPKNRCIFCSISAAYPSMPHSLIQNLLCGQDTTAQAIREVILDHILRRGVRGKHRCSYLISDATSPRGRRVFGSHFPKEKAAREAKKPRQLFS